MSDKYDSINPEHYKPGDVYEHRKVARAWKLSYPTGCATKYIARAGKKPGIDPREDILKAITYLTFELEDLQERLGFDEKYAKEIVQSSQRAHLLPAQGEGVLFDSDLLERQKLCRGVDDDVSRAGIVRRAVALSRIEERVLGRIKVSEKPLSMLKIQIDTSLDTKSVDSAVLSLRRNGLIRYDKRSRGWVTI